MTSSHKDYREEKKVVNGRKGLVSETGSLNRRASGLFACLDEPICASLVLLVFVISATGLCLPPSTERVCRVWFWNS